MLTVYVHASNLRPVVACKRGPIRKPSITPETPWTVAGARQEPLFEADGKLRIPLDVWKKSVWMAGKTPRGEAYGESVVTEIFLRGGSVCAEAIWRRFDTPGHEDQRSLGG